MISKEYGGAKRTIWSLFGARFGEEFGEALNSHFGHWYGTLGLTASGNLVVDGTVRSWRS